MGKVKNVQVVFDGNANVFSPGEIIRGKVLLQVDADEEQQGLKNVKGVWVQVNGETRIAPNTQPRHPTREEVYFDAVQLLFGTVTGAPDIQNLTIPPGSNSYPFAVQLPNMDLPAPFEGGVYGYIRYRVVATVSLKRMLSNKEYKAARYFSVTGRAVDLNTIPGSMTPVNYETSTRTCGGCGCTIATMISVGLPKQGYVPGESINLTGRVDNRHGDEERHFRAKLVQNVNFGLFDLRARGYHNTTVLARANSRVACPKGRVTDFAIGPLLIPPVPPTGLPGSRLINIHYYVRCKDSDCDAFLGVTIGNVPLRYAAIVQQPTAQVQLTTPPASLPGAPTPQQPAPTFDEDDLPPSYEEAVGVAERVISEHTGEEDFFTEDEFHPRYPYFRRMGDVASGVND